MLTTARSVRIEWGDCDPKGIVYYPRYFAIFAGCSAQLFERALGITQAEMRQAYPFSGFALATTRGRFFLAATVGDDLVVETTLAAFRHSSLEVQHRMHKQGELAVEGFETRVWMTRDPLGRANSAPIPESVRARLASPSG
jgi:4-hydroxybenzoyl-CoA thioesterase